MIAIAALSARPAATASVVPVSPEKARAGETPTPDPTDVLAEYERCDPFPASTAQLADYSDSAGTLRLRLPNGATPRASQRSWHGGEAWSAADIDASITFGYWGPHSFEPSTGERRCRTIIGGLRTLLIESNTDDHIRMIAWYLESGKPYDVVLDVDGPKGKRSTLLAIVNSMRRTTKP